MRLPRVVLLACLCLMPFGAFAATQTTSESTKPAAAKPAGKPTAAPAAPAKAPESGGKGARSSTAAKTAAPAKSATAAKTTAPAKTATPVKSATAKSQPPSRKESSAARKGSRPATTLGRRNLASQKRAVATRGRSARQLAAAEEAVPYKAALVLDLTNGQVLHDEHQNLPSDPASLTKMMTVLIALEKLEAGEIRMDQQVVVEEDTEQIGGHQVHLRAGEVFSLGELLKAVMIGSANDAAYAVAKTIAGSQEAFVVLMNERARQLGMHDTRYTNAHGLPADRRKGQEPNQTTAHDQAIVAQELMKHAQVHQWSSTREDTFRDNDRLVNTNHHFLEQFEGADGLKTGFHPRGAGFCVVATAVRNGRRLLSVVLGAPTKTARLQATMRLLESGFLKSANAAPVLTPVSATTATH